VSTAFACTGPFDVSDPRYFREEKKRKRREGQGSLSANSLCFHRRYSARHYSPDDGDCNSDPDREYVPCSWLLCQSLTLALEATRIEPSFDATADPLFLSLKLYALGGEGMHQTQYI